MLDGACLVFSRQEIPGSTLMDTRTVLDHPQRWDQVVSALLSWLELLVEGMEDAETDHAHAQRKKTQRKSGLELAGPE